MSDVISNINDAISEEQPSFADRYNQFVAVNEKNRYSWFQSWWLRVQLA